MNAKTQTPSRMPKAPEAPKKPDAPETTKGPETGAANVPAVPPKPMSLSQKALEIAGVNFKVTKQVTVPLLKHEENTVVAITITSPIYMGKEIKNKKDGTVVSAPAPMVKVTDLNTSSNREYIVPAVFQGVLTDNYPNDSYVGKSFLVNKLPVAPGKRYKPVEVLEIEPETKA